MTKSTTSDDDVQVEFGGSQVVIPALMRAARETYRKSIRRSLTEGGFDDLPKNGPFVLGGMVNFGFPLSDVVRELGVTKQAASQLIDVLVLRGYLERVPDPVDRRRVILKPTERGRGAATASRAGVLAIDRELARRRSPAELEAFRACLSALIEIGEGPHDHGHPEGKGEEPGRQASSPSYTHLIRFSPIFAVKDLRRALDHYRSLGFTVKNYAGGDEYGFAERDGAGIHLAAEEGYDPGRDASEAYLYVEDADSLAAEWSKPGIGGEARPVGTMQYHLREGSHVDLDNNVIRFGSDIASQEEEKGKATRSPR